ncbi:hypothetical protein HCN44_003335 [Aphidius gifuensis]|uniref:Uncharacterized protein n=1 Tax=Aphidius gifuensis TaxID=684658 RepID=A0A834XVM4_APHGI|nr:hypothetical protein HCN44_003335 [Aphidius gifuensis]
MSTISTKYNMESLYLEAIQKIPGKTPGEKYQALNRIAKKLIDDAMDIDDNCVKNVDVKSSAELPECLVPIVSLEVAKILRQPDGIVAALKSDDAFINERALKVKWFFDSSNENITNSQYFNKHIFPHVSLTVRIKIIKNLAKYLMLSNKQSVAENFYIELKEQYGKELVRPLCFACGEDFIRNTTNKWEKRVSVSELEIIYPRFPNFVISSLKENPHEYREFLPKLIKKHADSFVDIVIKPSENLVVTLSNKNRELLLKKTRNAFLDNPKPFMRLLPLKLITAKLNKLEFYQFYKQLFPQDYEEFWFVKLYQFLEFYPKEEKFNLLISTFEDVYGKSFLECVDSILFQMLIENYADVFVDIVKRFNLNNKLCNEKYELFLENVLNDFKTNRRLLDYPQSLQLIKTKLNKFEFYHFYKQLFPQKYEDLCFEKLYKYLEFYQEEEKLNLLISTFEDVYGKSFLECVDSISFQMLIENYADVFVDIVKRFNLNNKLCLEKYELFFKNVLNDFKTNRRLLDYSQSLQLITTKLNKFEFYQFYKQLFPQMYEEFCFEKLYPYLEFYQEEEKFNLLLSTFEDVYGISLLECTDLISPQLLRLLDPELRIKIAKKKMDKNDETKSIEYSWICYFPTNESIPFIKEKISKESVSDERCKYLQQLIYTCSVNNDNDALLNVLKYVFMRHKNEQYPVIPKFLSRLRTDFDVKNLPKEHLIIVDQFVMFLYIKYELKPCVDVSLNFIQCLIFSKLKHNEEFNKYIELYIDLDRKDISKRYYWNILEDYPDYERKYLIECIGHVCKHKDLPEFVNSLLRSMYSFNRRNAKTNVPLEKLSIKNYPLLYEAVKSIVTRDRKTDSTCNKNITDELLENGENDIFLCLVDTSNLPEKSPSDESDKSSSKSYEKIEFNNSNVIKLLQKSPGKIINNWSKYLELCKNRITTCNFVRRFLRYARWHQDLPIMFANECLKELEMKNNTDIHKNIFILAVLYDGASFERLFTPFIPESKTLNLTNSIRKDEYLFNCSILCSLNIVNPPVSFTPFFEFCQGDYVHDAVNTLNNVGRRVPVDKVIEFSKTLVNQKVSVKKHGIRLFCQVASHDQIHKMMLHLWKKEKNLSIRQVLYKNISKLFIDEPSSQSWSIMQTCMDETKTEDHFWDEIFDVSKIPDDFFESYILKLFETIKRIEETENDFGPSKSEASVSRILNDSLSKSYLFSEEFYQYIIKNYLTDFTRPEYFLSRSIQNYIIKKYIAAAGDKLESRLVHLDNVILKIVKTYWNVPFTDDERLLKLNTLIHKLIACICNINCNHIKIRTAKVVLDALLTVLKPEQLGTSYLDLVYAGILNNEYSIDQMTHELVQLIPSLCVVYSSELMPTIVQHFKEPLHIFLNNKKNIGVIDIIERLIWNDDKNVNFFTSTLLLQSFVSNGGGKSSIIINEVKIISEKLHEYIIRQYFANFARLQFLLSGRFQNYIINNYIVKAGDKLESRLQFLTYVLSEIVKTSWNVPSVYDFNLPTLNSLIHKLIELICNMKCNHIRVRTAKVVLDALLIVLKPEQLGTSYLDLVYAGILNNEYSIDQMTHELVQLIPSLEGIYTMLKPEQLGTSYLDLVYASILNNEYSIDQMTHELVQLIPSLVEMYSRTKIGLA